MVLDIFTLILFFVVSCIVHNQWVPRTCLLVVLLGLNAYSLTKHLIAFLGSFFITKHIKALITTYNVFFFVVDLLVVLVLLWEIVADKQLAPKQSNLIEFEPEAPKETFPWRHPVVLFYAIGARWIKLALTLLNVEMIGKAILPVWEAVKSRETITFMVYLLIAATGLTHAYYTFPMHDAEDVVMSFFRVFRIFLLADFDLYEMEGVDSVVDAHLSNGKLVGNIHDGMHRERIDGGIRQFISMAVFLGPVLFLNVFIGVLGKAYEDADAQIEYIFMKFRLDHLKTILFRDYVIHWSIWRRDSCGAAPAGTDKATWNDSKGLWIKLRASSFASKVDEDFSDLAKCF